MGGHPVPIWLCACSFVNILTTSKGERTTHFFVASLRQEFSRYGDGSVAPITKT